MNWSDTNAPDLAEIERLAVAAVDALPTAFATPAREVVFRIEDLASVGLLSDMEMDDPFQLTGLYHGVPLTERSASEPPEQPDVIWLFRRAILDEWASRGNVTLGELVGHIVVHELAHHFGWSDEDIARVDQWWT